MFSTYYNYILWVERNKSAEFNTHFFPHTHKLVLYIASEQATWTNLSLRAPLWAPGHYHLPLPFFSESSSIIFLRHDIIWCWYKLVQRRRKGIDGPFPSLSQANLWGKEQGKSIAALFRKAYFRLVSLSGWQGWAEIQTLIWRDSFGEVMDETVPQMLVVISPRKTVKSPVVSQKAQVFSSLQGKCWDLSGLAGMPVVKDAAALQAKEVH